MEGNGTSSKAIVLLLVVFVLGAVLGGLGTYLVAERVHAEQAKLSGHHDRAQIVADLTRELALTSEQQTQLKAILQDTRGRFDAIHAQVQPQYDAVRQQARNRIRAILTPEQQPKFEEFLRRLDEQRKKKEAR